MVEPAIQLDHLVARARQLCSLPAVAVKVLELTSNPQVDSRALKECIENDPALTSKILRVVNSSLFGLSREVSTLSQALALLGNKPLKLLVLGFSLPPRLFEGLSGEIVERYWQRTLTKAVAARELSETVWKLPGDEAFIVALLQDVGVLLLIQEFGKPYVSFLNRVYESRAELAPIESRAMNFNHIELSSRLLAQWGLPETMVEAVAWNPANATATALAQIVHLAELVSQLMLDGRPGALGELMERGRRYHGLTEVQLEGLVSRLEEKVRQLADVLSLQLPDGLHYSDVLLQSQSQIAEVAAATAGEMIRRHVSDDDAAAGDAVLQEIQCLSQAATMAATKVDATAHEVVPTYEALGSESNTAVTDARLLGAVKKAAAGCRQSRCALSLLLVEIHEFPRLSQTRGAEAAERLRWLLEAFCNRLGYPGEQCVSYGDANTAVILPDCDRSQVLELANQLHANVHKLEAIQPNESEQPFLLDIGAATVFSPPRNFSPQDLLVAADRCLYGSRTSSGGITKSIEIF